MIDVSVTNLSGIPVRKTVLKRAAEIFFEKKNFPGSVDLSIVLVSRAKMRKLNEKYRHKQGVTDVLSFNLSSGHHFPSTTLGHSLLGEIVICPYEVKRQAKIFQNSFQKELIKVLVHSILHLLGFEHERSKKAAQNMRAQEEKYLKFILPRL